ncbi:MAG: hypothetical protein A3G45_00380 [Candidatus Staskawiczbacteria bacterium RIFCSPLOWO2_12_FULL_37_15]|uniref:Uncharacterized protein n=1 Tax=Candidatus Staskawiczbacteria bacterium RIFCSPLOWO2_12_FULL_37_15 TaxID=1802218 RepID=A0A1G2IPG8_9BACT|nr:MAG: hypothetical protein A3G45_00380 [Candidatus Staskawiczbacteria bacterium RIFCSPLOWO2_12_FULL_37_15]
MKRPNWGGRGGSRTMDSTAEETSPSIASVIMVLVKYGRLKDRTVLLNSGPPTTTGSQPKRNSITAFVDQEWLPSAAINP